MENKKRISLYNDYDLMDKSIISSAIDLYTNSSKRSIIIHSDNDIIKKYLDVLFGNILDTSINLKKWIRNMVKYGDHFLYINTIDGRGITHAISLPPHEVIVDENYDKDFSNRYFVNLDSIDKFYNIKSGILSDEEVVHFRLLGDNSNYPYGVSLIEDARTTYKQLNLLEHALVIGSSLGKNNEDSYYNRIEDIKYMENKLFSELKIPKMYIEEMKPIVNNMSSLEYLHFTNVINEIEQAVVLGLKYIAFIHLISLMVDDRINFKLELI